MLLKNILGENSHLIAYLSFCFYLVASWCLLVLLVLLMLLVLLVRAKSFCKKKEFKTALITSLLLLLKFILLQA